MGKSDIIPKLNLSLVAATDVKELLQKPSNAIIENRVRLVALARGNSDCFVQV